MGKLDRMRKSPVLFLEVSLSWEEKWALVEASGPGRWHPESWGAGEGCEDF